MRRFAFAILLLLVAARALPCTTFCIVRDGEVLLGRNYDFETADGYVMTNRRGVAKTSLAGTLGWTSRYGSVTTNQWGKEFPTDGMNEAGLAVSQMWLDETVHPVDSRPPLRCQEWIQYQLDNFSTVEEVLSHAHEVRISGRPLHYLIADATGDAASIEFLSGEMVVHRGASLAPVALTNSTYDDSLSYLAQFRGFGGTRPMPAGRGSLDRFVRAAMLMGSSEASVDAAFSILSAVAQPGFTRWSVVYDPRRREVSWTTDRSAERKRVRLDALSFQCTAEGRMLDVHSPLDGDVTMDLEPYSAARNRDLVIAVYAHTEMTRNTPVHYAIADAAHAESFRCVGRRRAVRVSR